MKRVPCGPTSKTPTGAAHSTPAAATFATGGLDFESAAASAAAKTVGNLGYWNNGFVPATMGSPKTLVTWARVERLWCNDCSKVKLLIKNSSFESASGYGRLCGTGSLTRSGGAKHRKPLHRQCWGPPGRLTGSETRSHTVLNNRWPYGFITSAYILWNACTTVSCLML